MDILDLFGINWKLMLAQIVNFAIVVAVLWWFALKPLIKKMKERNEEISKGLSDAKAAEGRLSEVEKVVNDKIKESKFDAAIILNEAKKQAEETKQIDIKKTKEEVEKMIYKARVQLENEKEKMVDEVKGDLGEIVITALNKILAAGVSKEMDKKIIDKAMREIK